MAFILLIMLAFILLTVLIARYSSQLDGRRRSILALVLGATTLAICSLPPFQIQSYEDGGPSFLQVRGRRILRIPAGVQAPDLDRVQVMLAVFLGVSSTLGMLLVPAHGSPSSAERMD